MRNYIRNLEDLPCWCGNHSYQVLIKVPRQNFEILRCSHCGLVRTFPLPDFSKERYVDYEIDVYLRNKKLFLSFMKEILDEVWRFKKEGYLLEIGSGVGYFLELAKEKGFEVSGIELSKEAVKIAQKNLGEKTIKDCLLSEANFPDKHFDIVVMNHVLEHILDLKSLLDEINRILKKDGILVIGSPNFDGFFAKLRGRKWSGLRSNEHIWQFESKTISNVLRANNLKIIRLKKGASHNLKTLFIERNDNFKEFLLKILNIILGKFGLGDNTIIIAVKNDQ